MVAGFLEINPASHCRLLTVNHVPPWSRDNRLLDLHSWSVPFWRLRRSNSCALQPLVPRPHQALRQPMSTACCEMRGQGGYNKHRVNHR